MRSILANSRRTSALTAVVLAGVLIATASHAANVSVDGDVATHITDLTIGSKTYDVEFTCNTTTFEHWSKPPTFDFTNPTDAFNAVQAIVAAVNEKGSG